MTDVHASKRPQAVIVAVALVAIGLASLGIALASRPDKPVDEACQNMHAAIVAQSKIMSWRADEPVGAAADRAMTAVAAARRLCESGDIKGARMLYQRAENFLTRFQAAAENSE